MTTGFVGESRRLLAEGLVAVTDLAVQRSEPCWVSLEAPSGWGKTRVGREFYALLAQRQEAPRYWPRAIEDKDRKQTHPTNATAQREAGSLPDFMWWGIACSRRNGTPSEALREDAQQLIEHRVFLAAQWRALASFGERHGQKWRDARTALADEAEDMVVDSAAQLVSEVIGAAIPGFAQLVRFGRWAHGNVSERRESNALVESAGRPHGGVADDLVDDVVALLGALGEAGVPIVVLVEDVHQGDPMLWELIDKLIRRGGPIVIVTTTWPDMATTTPQLAELMRRHSDHVLRVHHDETPPAPFPTGASLGPLETEARRDIVRHFYPNVHPETEQALIDRYLNLHALEVVCRLPKYQERFGERGDLHLPVAEIERLPQATADLFEEIWSALPDSSRLALAVAAMMTSASIATSLRGADSTWQHRILCEVIAHLDLSARVEILEHIESVPEAFAWVHIIDAALREFSEPDQLDIAARQGPQLLGKHLFGDVRVEVLSVLVERIAQLPADERDTPIVARTILALDERDLVDDPDLVCRATVVVLEALASAPRELPERVRLFAKALEKGDPSDQSCLVDLLVVGGIAVLEIGQPTVARGHLERALDISVDRVGTAHPSALAVRSKLALCLGESGHAEEAIAQTGPLLLDSERLLGVDHPATLVARHNLAFWSGEVGRVDEAITRFEELIPDRQRVLGHGHRHTLASRNSLAFWLGKAGRLDEAITQFEQLLLDRQRLLGGDDPDTLITRNNLANCLGRAGRVDEAIAQFEQLLIDRQRVVGPDHPDCLETRNSMGYWLGMAGHVDAAIAEFERLVLDRHRIHGTEHRDTLLARSNLASMLGEAGHLDEAISQFEQLLVDRQRVIGADDPATLATLGTLAVWLFKAGLRERAVTRLEQLSVNQVRVLGPEHPDTLRVRGSLAAWCGEVGQIDKAISQFEQLLRDRQRVFGVEHPDTVTTRSSLAWWLVERQCSSARSEAPDQPNELMPDLRESVGADAGRALLASAIDLSVTRSETALAIRFADELIAMELDIDGPDAPPTLAARHRRANLMGDAAALSQAVAELRIVVEGRTLVLGADHLDTLTSRSDLAYWLFDLGDLEEAIALDMATVRDRSRLLGQEHPDTLTTRGNLAFALGTAGRLTEAIDHTARLAADRLRAFGEDDQGALRARSHLAWWLFLAGRVAEALDCVADVLEDQMRVLGADHADTILTLERSSRIG